MKQNRFNRLMSPPDDDAAGIASDGLGARLGAFLEQNPTGVAPEGAPSFEPPSEPPAPTPPVPNEQTPPTPNPPEDEEEEFPELGKPAEAPKPDDFDEAAFDAETEKEIKGMDPKAGAKWKALKAEVKASKQQLHELKGKTVVPKEVEAELVQLRETATAKEAEATALRQRNEELLKVNDTVAVRESEAFIKQIKEPVAEMEQIIVQMATSANLDPSVLFQILEEQDIGKQDKALDQIQGKLGSRLSGRLERLADDYKAIQAKSAQMLADAPKTLAAERARREQAAIEEKNTRLTSFRSATKESFTAYGSRVPGFTDSAGQLTDVARATLEKTASIDPDTLSPNDWAFMAFTANSFPEMRRAYVKLQKDYDLLKAGKTPPGPLSGTPPGGEPPVPEGDKEMGLIERMKGQTFTFAGG